MEGDMARFHDRDMVNRKRRLRIMCREKAFSIVLTHPLLRNHELHLCVWEATEFHKKTLVHIHDTRVADGKNFHGAIVPLELFSGRSCTLLSRSVPIIR